MGAARAALEARQGEGEGVVAELEGQVEGFVSGWSSKIEALGATVDEPNPSPSPSASPDPSPDPSPSPSPHPHPHPYPNPNANLLAQQLEVGEDGGDRLRPPLETLRREADVAAQ